ncbi:MAG: GNA1162 family protein [Syntrophobacteria bacterium]
MVNKLTAIAKCYMKQQVPYLLSLKGFNPSLCDEEILMIRVANLANFKKLVLSSLIIFLFACAPGSSLTYFHDPQMDFAAVRSVAVMPFENLTRDSQAGERVRTVFASSLLSTGAVYVIPAGEVSRGITRAGILNPANPSTEEIEKFAGIIKVDALITGGLTEYGQVRSGNATANVVSMNVRMIEIQSRRTVWTASATRGGISIWDRLFGGGGEPMNDVIMEAVNDVLDKLFM